MISVQTPSRLHFGLLNVGAAQPWLNIDGQAVIPARQFGGAGMMVNEPAIVVRIQPAKAWSAHGPLAEKALAFARQFAATVSELSPQQIQIETLAPAHVGLGTGTQLALAVAKALAITCGHDDWDSVELARRVGRGRRSAVGIYGFLHGGFIVEGGKCPDSEIGPLVARYEVPSEWHIVLVLPQSPVGRSGEPERKTFEDLMQRATTREVET
ncbi:MAG TPA: hypothetical protein VGZ47_06235, partial [Gemmataceae bacterium]|nr:hypothetical protein [Gemmataceae bacterium]